MLIDTHAHLNFDAFKNDYDKVIEDCLKNDIWVINIGTNFKSSKRAVEISENYEKGVFASIGLHPINLDTDLVKMKVDKSEGSHFEKEFDYQKYKNLAKSKKVIAIGEIGLDYYYRPKTKRKKELFKQKQKDLLLKQIKLAEELNLPIIFHCRMAHNDLIEILNYELKTKNYQLKGVMHGFVGVKEQLKKYLEMGFYIGFNGIIFKSIEGISFEENIKETPIEKILIETDCPFLNPIKKEERNTSLNLKYIVKKIAEVKNLNFEKIAKQTTENAKKLFKI